MPHDGPMCDLLWSDPEGGCGLWVVITPPIDVHWCYRYQWVGHQSQRGGVSVWAGCRTGSEWAGYLS